MKLTNPRVAPSNEDHLVGKVTTLQDLQGRSVSIIAFWLHQHILHCECLTRVKVGGPLVNVTENGREKDRRCQDTVWVSTIIIT